jgi:ATP-dependent RNA helicase MSS116
MSRQPTRKSDMGRRNRHPYRPRRPAANQTPASSASPAQQPSVPAVQPPTPMDPRRLYSTTTTGQEAKSYASLTGTLDKALLQGLEKMGFEYDALNAP